MPEEQRFTVHGKLAVEVLGALLEGTLRLTPQARLAALMQQRQAQAQAQAHVRAGPRGATPFRAAGMGAATPASHAQRALTPQQAAAQVARRAISTRW